MPKSLLILSVFFLAGCASHSTSLSVTSAAFSDGGMIPATFTCDGSGVSLPVSIGNVPSSAKAVGLSVLDPDAPVSGGFLHWAWIAPATVTSVPEGSVPASVTQLRNGAGKIGYFGPCPPTGPAHHYQFHAFAYSEMPVVPAGSSKEDIERILSAHVIASGSLAGLYQRAQ